VLVVGAGPAGLEAACALGQRGYAVILAEAEQELGGRINRESRLPGLAEYARVRDWRLGQLARMPKVQVYPDNRLDAASIIELECQHVLLATGARWRSDGVGQTSNRPFQGCEQAQVIGVEQVLDGFLPTGHVVIYDDDHYYLGSAIALRLCAEGVRVTMVSPENSLGGWTHFTDEHTQVMRALIDAGVEVITARALRSFEPKAVRLACVYSGNETEIEADYLLPIGARVANDGLWLELQRQRESFAQHGGISMQRIGDCRAPGIIAAAVYAGHKAARELGQGEAIVKRDRVVLLR